MTLLGLYLLSAYFLISRDLPWPAFPPKYLIVCANRSFKRSTVCHWVTSIKSAKAKSFPRITNDVDTLSQSLNQSVTQLITSVTSMVGVLIMMLSISWQLTLVALCILPLSLLLVMGVVKKSQGYFRGQQKYLGAVNGHVERNVRVVTWWSRLFNGEEKSVKTFDEQNKKIIQCRVEKHSFCLV